MNPQLLALLLVGLGLYLVVTSLPFGEGRAPLVERLRRWDVDVLVTQRRPVRTERRLLPWAMADALLRPLFEQSAPIATGPIIPSPPNLLLDIGRCGHDAWPAEATAGLIDHGFGCNPSPAQHVSAPTSTRSNYRTTWVDTRTIAYDLVQHLRVASPMPDIHIGINPNPGVVAIDSWFWIDRTTYTNAPLEASASQSFPWQESWDEMTTHDEDVSCDDGSPGPCHRTVSETHLVVVPHTDHIAATDTFTPASYTWNFGDGRPGSQKSYPADRGFGRPYTNPNTPSTVAWGYEFDSRDYPKGFPITVVATWGVTYQAHASSDIPQGNYDVGGSMDPRSETYGTTHVVRQVRAPRIAQAVTSR
jgi:hypothetical protein